MRRLGLVMMAIGMVFLLSGVVATAWAASQASAMSEEDRALDPERYDFYCSAQSCSLGSAAIGLVIVAIGILIGKRAVAVVEESQGKIPNEGGQKS